jgi:DNA-binding winged helix-turn-helix (wHTH) protein/Tol biopolymer transport system component
MSSQANGLYEFGSFRLDAAKRLLTRSGESIALAPKTFDLLLLLVGGQGRVLTKTELMSALWPDTFVEEASLSYQVATLRKALGSEGDACIETVPKHGYKFTAAITQTSNDREQRHDESAIASLGTARLRPRPLLLWLVASTAVFVAVVFAVLYFRQIRKSVPTQSSIRFFVSPPEKVALTERPLPAISPDGELLAFGGIDPDGTTRIWVRPMASLTAVPVQGTEGAYSLFWSPDSRSLGFFTGEKLKTVQLHGGPPRALCDASAEGRPVGAWNRDGVILFNSLDRRGLYRMAATGGEATPVTTLDPAGQEVQHLWPQFLRDGRHFIYLVQSARPENTGIYAGSLDSKERKLILRTSSIAAYAGLDPGTGYLLYMRGGTLMAQRFDDRRLASEGEPLPIAEQVWLLPSGGQGFAAFSASGNGVVAYRTHPAAATELVWFDRKGNRLGTVGAPANYSVPALSPDEKKLAITRIDPQIGTKDVWLFDLARGTLARFTFDPAEETNPTWSPDGNQIAFISRQKGLLNLYRKATSGAGDAEPLLESDEEKIIQNWSPSGRFILYDAGDRLWALPLTGDRKPISLFATRGDSRANISPDGRWVAYQSSESGRTEVYVQSFPPSGSKWQVSTDGARSLTGAGMARRCFTYLVRR